MIYIFLKNMVYFVPFFLANIDSQVQYKFLHSKKNDF